MFFFKSSGNRSGGSGATPAKPQIATDNRMSAPYALSKQEKQLKQEQEFAEMERSIHRIHYFFQKADMPLEMRQVLTYRKLMELKYFTPQAARELLRQWQQQEEQQRARASSREMFLGGSCR